MNSIQLTSGHLNSVLSDYLDLPPGSSPTPSPSDKVQSVVLSCFDEYRPLPTLVRIKNAISRILYKERGPTPPGALHSALNHYLADPTAALLMRSKLLLILTTILGT
jgi:hypothetical protein